MTSGPCSANSDDLRALRVGYVVKRYPRFSETFIVNEILAHEAVGVEIDVFSLRTSTDSHFQDKLSQVRAGVVYLPDGNGRGNDLWQALQLTAAQEPRVWPVVADASRDGVASAELAQALALASLVRRRGIEHLHAHFATSAAEVARLTSAITGVPYSLTAHAKDIFHDDVRDADLQRKIASASRVITVSDFNLRYLRQKFPQLAQQIVRIYNGLDLADLAYRSPAMRPPRIVAVGRLVEKKGFDDLVKSCAVLKARGVRFHCDIIGEGDCDDQLSQLISQFKLDDCVRMVGPKCRGDVARAMQSAAVMAAPCVVGADGNRDGMPTVLLEAMALGTPCVATDVTGIPELIRHGETGLLVPERSPEQLADAIARLLADGDLRTSLAEAARRVIESEFDAHRNAAAQREVFEQSQRRQHGSISERSQKSLTQKLVSAGQF